MMIRDAWRRLRGRDAVPAPLIFDPTPFVRTFVPPPEVRTRVAFRCVVHGVVRAVNGELCAPCYLGGRSRRVARITTLEEILP